MRTTTAGLVLLLAGCFGRSGDVVDQVDAGDVDAGSSSTSSGTRDVLVLSGGSDAAAVDAGAQLVDAAADAGAQLVEPDAGAQLVDAAAVDAAAVDAGTDASLPGVADSSRLVEYGSGTPYNARFGCLPGYLNCDGFASTGCELDVGCPVDDGQKCATCAGGTVACWCKGPTCWTAPNSQACP